MIAGQIPQKKNSASKKIWPLLKMLHLSPGVMFDPHRVARVFDPIVPKRRAQDPIAPSTLARVLVETGEVTTACETKGGWRDGHDRWAIIEVGGEGIAYDSIELNARPSAVVWQWHRGR